MSIGTIENSEVRIGVSLTVSYHIRDEIRFVFFIDSLEYDDLFSYRITREESFLHLIGIIFDHGVGRIDDDLSRPVVLFEIDDHCRRVVFFEREDILDIRPTPRVDPLPIITDDTEIFRFTREYPDDFILEHIGILVLIDHEILEPIMEILEHLRQIEHLTEQEEEIIKINCIVRLESARIFLVDLECDTLRIGVYCSRVVAR